MAEYFVDFTNGSDAKDGTSDPADKSSPHSAEASTDATHVYVTDGILTDGDADDFFNGDFLFNVTRDAGALITDYDADDGSGNSVVTHGNIANQVATDTFYILKSWKTVSKAATTLTAGNEARVRGGMSETPTADIAFTNDGTAVSPILIQGIYTAGGTDDWGDGNTTRPVIDWNDGNFSFFLSTDNFWQIKGLDIKDSHDTIAAMRLQSSSGIVIEDCRFYDNGLNAGDAGIYALASTLEIIDCVMDNNLGYNIINDESIIEISGCTLNGDGDNAIGSSGQSTDYGLYSQAGITKIKETTFGADTNGDHDTADFRIIGGEVWMRNTDLDSATQIEWSGSRGAVHSEDDGQVHLAYKSFYPHGTRERSATYERSGAGGTAWSIKMEAGSTTGDYQPLYGMGNWLIGLPVYLDGTEQTITVYALCHDNVAGTFVSADKFRLDVEHYEGAADWEIDLSDEDFAAEDTWTAFSVTVTPGAAGPAYLKIRLLEYNANHDIYIDPTPVIS